MQEPSLSSYTDHRLFLKDVFMHRKALSKNSIRPYSYSDFSAAANIKSPNYLKLIISGQRNLSDEMILKFSKALKLNKNSTKEFKVLVHYGQSTEPMAKNKFLKKLSELRSEQALSTGTIDNDTWEKVPNWLSWVIYAMIDQSNIKFTAETIQSALKSRCSIKDIQTAINKLVESGDIKINEHGQAVKTSKMISGAEKIPPELIRKLQEELIYLGLESLHTDDPKEREVSGFTFALTKQESQWVRHELRKLRKELQTKIMLERESKKGDQVYQVNIQMYPLTSVVQKEKGSESPSTRDIDI